MKLSYNKIAGKNTQRIEAISDGIFAVAMTLLVLEIKVPAAEGKLTEGELAHVLLAQMPRFLVYFLSFMTAGIFWVGQSAQFAYIEKSDRNLNWLSLLFLLFVSLLPFSTAFLSDYTNYRFAIFVYWFNILMLGVSLYINWSYAVRHRFVETESDLEAISGAIKRRIIVAQLLYFAGALLCFINTYLSIGFIILVQLNYAFGIVAGRRKQ
ncbi:TMEM175 family protein [Chitinophaga sp. 22536]|uniref:TMEM175 family protein n=1 Tax=unclassified Chitinophaga TaxID=2619133 RepID=UPI003F855A60